MRFLVLVFIFILSFNIAFAYSESTTHPALTDEIIDLFNMYYPELKISEEYKELAKRGSTDEDKKPRSMYHFYDPVYNRGIHLAGTKWQSSKDWAQDTMGQARLWDQVFAGSLTSYFGSDADHSWGRAIYEYAWGDKKRGITDLGHILHLIEDASVPDHTRNDPHPPWFSFGSPYEARTAQFDSEKLEGLAKSLFDSKKKLVTFNDLQNYFESMANYSNNNFFSKDTIFDKNYTQPVVTLKKIEVLSDGQFYKFGYGPKETIRLVLIGERKLGSKKVSYSIEDPDEKIFSDYWDRLSKQVVLHGAGVVKLFFDEVKKEKESRVLFNKNKSWFARAYDATKDGIFGIAATLYGSSLKDEDLMELNPEKLAGLGAGNVTTPQPPSSIRRGDESGSQFSSQVPEVMASPSPLEGEGGDEVVIERSEEEGQNGTENPPFALTKGEGGEGVRGQEGAGGDVAEVNLEVRLLSGGGGSGGAFNTPRIPPENDNVAVISPMFDFSSSTSIPETPDTTPPNISLAISNCSSSLSSDGCLLSNSNISILWSSTSTDVVSYDVECSLSGSPCSSFSIAATTATSTNYSLPIDEKTYEFKARARDATGNASSWSIITLDYYSSPVVINEVAWAGTSASSADEWIELFNKTGKNISLSGWSLYAQDLVPYLNLSGAISANGYYLIERTDDNTISDISADLITAFSGVGSGSGLSNGGEVLILSQASTTIDQTVLCSNAWCGGTSSNGNLSMERIDPNVAGIDSTNWGTMQYLTTRNGKDADNLQLNATPKKRNSLNYLISQTNNLSSNKTLTKSKSPYIVPTSQDFVINSSATLTIEPGVVIKMGDQSSVTVNGNIISQGTASEYVTFTSIYDDIYEGDTNGDGSASLPVAGSWKYLRINPPVGGPSESSILSYTKFKYGGRYFSLTPSDLRAMVSIYEATTTILNSIFEESQIAGLRATRFNGTISGSSFNTGTTTNTDKIGLYIFEGNPTISGNTFLNNYSGLTLESATASLDNLTFSNNYLGIQSTNSTLNVANPTSIIFNSNTATTSPSGLF